MRIKSLQRYEGNSFGFLCLCLIFLLSLNPLVSSEAKSRSSGHPSNGSKNTGSQSLNQPNKNNDDSYSYEDMQNDFKGTGGNTYDPAAIERGCQQACQGSLTNDGSCMQNCIQTNLPRSKADESFETCVPKIKELDNICKANAQEAENACDEKKDSGLTNAQQAINALGQQVNSSIQGACSTMGMVGAAANAAVATYQMTCKSAVDACKASCDEGIKYYKDNNGCFTGVSYVNASDGVLISLSESQKKCRALMAKAAQAQQSIQNVLGTIMQAKSCADMSSGLQVPAICKTNPNLPGCSGATSMDCSRPEMANEKVCICSLNPNNPACLNLNSINEIAPSGGANNNGVNLKGSKAGDTSSDGDLYGLNNIPQGVVKSNSGDTPIDGKQGRGVMLGSDSGSGSGSGSSGSGYAGDSGAPPTQSSGFYGGGGSNPWGNNTQGRSGSSTASGSYGSIKEANRPDLRQFLPGGAFDPRRGVAGLVGVTGPDGITGPATDIWLKVQNRYNFISGTLMP